MSPETSPWLDLERRPQRRHLLRLQAAGAPAAASPTIVDRLAEEVARLWAERVGLDPAAVVLCGRHHDALSLPLRGALTPDDRVVLARPAPVAWQSAVLAVGATFVDLGRLQEGGPDPAALQACPPARIALLGAPARTGADDASRWPRREGELRVADASRSGRLCGAPVPGADVTIAALRDPAAPAAPLAWAVLGAPELHLLQGPGSLPRATLERALAALQRIDAAAEARFEAALEARAAALEAALPLGPGQSWLPRAGVCRALRCLAADGADLLPAVHAAGATARAWGAFPGGGLLDCDLV